MLWPRLWLTAKLMFWVMVVMVPGALLLGVLAGMREGSAQDRVLSTVAIGTTSTPEYVSGVVLTVIFASQMVGLQWFSGSATSAADDGITLYNFALPVLTIAIYGMGYVARMTRASMAEVMTQQYIRTARLKGVRFPTIVLRHALRNALIAPFTVIMLQFPWLLTGVVIVETLFNYRGFGWLLIEGAGNNDIDLLLACSIVAVVIVLSTQLISDIGYVYLNPRIRVGLMELAFLGARGDRRRHPRALPAGLDRHGGDHGAASFAFRRRLGPYGKLYDSGIGMVGFGLVLFWLLTALMAHWVAPFDPYVQVRALKNKAPGAFPPELAHPYLFGGDALGRDVFSPHGLRLAHGDGDRPARDALRLHGRDHPRPAGRLPRRLARHRALASSPTSSSPSR